MSLNQTSNQTSAVKSQKQLLDQYGMPIRKQNATRDTRAPGAGGGYKKVEDDGHGKVTYRDYDPLTGILRVIHFDGAGGMVTKRWQNVEAIVDMNKVYTDDYVKHNKAKMERQTAIPTVEFWKIMEQCGYRPGKGGGEYDKKKFDQIINDPDHAKFRTRPGKISCQYRTWY